MKKSLVEPFEKAGYDLDATLKDFAVRLRDQNYTVAQLIVIDGVMKIYGQVVSDLARLGFIEEETANLVTSALKR